MERIPRQSVELLTILFFIIGTCQVESATVTAGDDKAGPLGSSHNVSITCTYTLDTGETADTMTIQRRRVGEGTFGNIASFSIQAGSSSYGDLELRDRADLLLLDGSATIRLNTILCNDAGTYKCLFQYNRNQVLYPVNRDMVLSVEASPEAKPIFMGSNPNEGPFTEDETMQLRCDGDVGLPAGNILWFGYKGNQITDLTSHAEQLPPLQGNSGPRYCVFRRESTLKLNMSRDYNGFTFRCTVNQSLHIASPDTETCVETACVQTQLIVVHYPVRQADLLISSNPDGNIIVGSGVTLKCTVEGNPAPTFRWVGEENKTFEGNEWKLNNLQLGDTGVYSCHANNVVNGTMYNVSKSVNINVVETTTPAQTTSTVTQTSPNSGGKTDAVRPSPNVETTTPAQTTSTVTQTSPNSGGKTDDVRPSPNVETTTPTQTTSTVTQTFPNSGGKTDDVRPSPNVETTTPTQTTSTVTQTSPNSGGKTDDVRPSPNVETTTPTQTTSTVTQTSPNSGGKTDDVRPSPNVPETCPTLSSASTSASRRNDHWLSVTPVIVAVVRMLSH